jgi:hypothetical protein
MTYYIPKHTEGDWFVTDDTDRNGQAIVRTNDIEIATFWHHCVVSIERQMWANAQLCSAAPDLLAACKAMKGHSDTCQHVLIESEEYPCNCGYSLARAAIQKAEDVSVVL